MVNAVSLTALLELTPHQGKPDDLEWGQSGQTNANLQLKRTYVIVGSHFRWQPLPIKALRVRVEANTSTVVACGPSIDSASQTQPPT